MTCDEPVHFRFSFGAATLLEKSHNRVSLLLIGA